MASFSRLVGGEWRLTAPGMKGQLFDTWHWGPGRHSVRVMTDGIGGDGKPWHALRIFYWHPRSQQVRLLGMSPYARGVSEGTITFNGDTADAVFDLCQTGRRRKMGMQWTFHGPDKYHDILLEATGPEGLQWMNAWDHVRSMGPPAPRPSTTDLAPAPSRRLTALAPLLGHTWQTSDEVTAGNELPIQTTFEYIPYADAIYARTVALSSDAEPTHLLDTYLYHHTGTNTLRSLALSDRGGVYEGDIAVLDGGALEFDLIRHERDEVISRVVRFDFEPDGSLRQRVWSLNGSDRILTLDTHHNKLKRQ